MFARQEEEGVASGAKAMTLYWSGLSMESRRSLTSEKKHVVLQSLRKKHLHTRNCPCCQHSKVRSCFPQRFAGTFPCFLISPHYRLFFGGTLKAFLF